MSTDGIREEAEGRFVGAIAAELKAAEGQVRAVAALLAEGATVPFIARYRKEATGSLDEVAVAAVRDRLEQLRELDKRRQAVLASLDEQGQLTPALKKQVEGAATLTALEDLYLPYRPKRRTRATMARERGLEPLAELLWRQEAGTAPEAAARSYIDAAKDVEDAEAALAGARDILAEKVSEDAGARQRLRQFLWQKGRFASKVIVGKEPEAAKYRDYFACEEAVATVPSHRLLAMRRGEKEKVLTLRLVADEEEAYKLLAARFVRGDSAASQQVAEAVKDAYRRLLLPSLETEIRVEAKRRADGQAIGVFAENLRQLLLAAPLGGRRVLAIDPGFRTGCKLVCLDGQGMLLHAETIFPHQGQRRAAEAAERLRHLCTEYAIEAVAIGNGTGGRETESFARQAGLGDGVEVQLVNESGASVYSASQVARDEFPDQDLTVRGSVSIGRRLMDPLAELVKIDPKAIGVGQYQHDVDQAALKRSLDDVVVSCVNSVGVELNTASKELLSYVSGLGPQLAANIVAHRQAHGPFRRRRGLLEVPRLGPKAFEQAAGFLRIRDGEQPLDASAVHPERYAVVEGMARDLGCGVGDLIGDEAVCRRLDLQKYVGPDIGLPTLEDITAELARPGRDPRGAYEAFAYADGVDKMEDLKEGMKLPGIVTNITAFGAFVDIGVHQDGLVHVSQLADRYVRDPNQVVKLRQAVEVTVVEVDLARKRIALSMRQKPLDKPQKKSSEQSAEGTKEAVGAQRGVDGGQGRKSGPAAGQKRDASKRPARQRAGRDDKGPARRDVPSGSALAEALKKSGLGS